MIATGSGEMKVGRLGLRWSRGRVDRGHDEGKKGPSIKGPGKIHTRLVGEVPLGWEHREKFER